MPQIEDALLGLFNKLQIFFWYDTKKEFRQTYNEIYLPSVDTTILLSTLRILQSVACSSLHSLQISWNNYRGRSFVTS
ncbi:MAG: hypothetical protein NTZ74_12020 [Chloroflexi bacterium]|nr:hypothetical protein [Chloroflexota bacterium]